MKKSYSNPELEIREYSYVEGSVLTDSQPDLNTDDIYDLNFIKGNRGN